MLSRVAHQVYWLARHLERTEETARLVMAYYLVVLDLPKSVKLEWHELIDVADNWQLFESRYKRHDERNIMNFMLADRHNPGSVASSIALARENLRTTREIYPSEVWETLNRLHHFSTENAGRATARRYRYEYLSDVIRQCQQIYGMLSGTLSRDAVYRFITLGFNVERIDMTTRILDVGSATLGAQSEISERFRDALWLSIVKAVNAEQMFRRRQVTVSAESVVSFLLHDPGFPRAISRSLAAMDTSLRDLPRHRRPLEALRHFKNEVDAMVVDEAFSAELTVKLRWLQTELADVHARIAKTWFRI